MTMVMLMGKQELVDGAGGRLGDSGQRNVIILTERKKLRKQKVTDAETLCIVLETQTEPPGVLHASFSRSIMPFSY